MGRRRAGTDDSPVPSGVPGDGVRMRADAATLLWGVAYERLAQRAAHEFRNALNGVSVNIEVVRGRLARLTAAEAGNGEPAAGAPAAPLASAVQRFADTAATQLDALTAITEAFLGLARPPREPVDVGTVMAQLAAVLGPVARSEGGDVLLDRPDGGALQTAAGGAIVRALLTTVLDAAVGRGRVVHCRVEASGTGGAPAAGAVRVIVRATCTDGSSPEPIPPPPALLLAAAADADVGVLYDAGVATLVFPGA